MPAVALCAAGTYFLIDKLPRLSAEHREIASREYRSVAEDMYEDPLLADDWGARQKGWRQTGKLGKRGSAVKVPWGHVSVSGGELVWCGTDEGMVAKRVVPSVDDHGLALWLKVGVPVLLFAMLSLSLAGAAFFYRYSRSRDDFLAAAAHDLTTPLVAMRRIIGRDDGYALKLNERMLVMVKNISAFLRLGGKRPIPVFSEFDLAEAFREAYGIFDEDFADSESGPIDMPSDRQVMVLADRALVMQALWNLIGNELKYAAPFGRVRMEVTVDGCWGVLRISDEGPGMTAHERRHAFDRYYRAKTIMESGKGGFGIGLCSACEFTRLMGGTLTVGDNSPHGCVFELRLKRPSSSARDWLTHLDKWT